MLKYSDTDILVWPSIYYTLLILEAIVKDSLLKSAQHHVQVTNLKIQSKIQEIKDQIETIQARVNAGIYGRGDDQTEVTLAGLARSRELVQQYELLSGSPYFSTCLVHFAHEESPEEIHIGMFSFLDEKIYSWVAPVARIRFARPGNFSYVLPTGGSREGELFIQDKFNIENSRIRYMSRETREQDKILIYQENFTERKKGFGLSNIVTKMEEYQDTIIRIPYNGSLLISGPAGSGKTTLALHRIAYLTQSPDTSELFPKNSSIVFLQDLSTKQYFAELLPKLGITNVVLTTFIIWAKHLLNIQDLSLIHTWGSADDEYLYAKSKSSKRLNLPTWSKNYYKNLVQVYENEFSDEQAKLFARQRNEKVLDVFDITLLLRMYQTHAKTNERIRLPHYSLVLVDEAENYLAEQIKIIQQCVSPKTNALIYIGDLAQQTYMFTLKSWGEVNENFPDDRKVLLPKGYRNAKQILQYIHSLGYDIDTETENDAQGQVVEKVFSDISSEVSFVLQEVAKIDSNQTVGIIANEAGFLDHFAELANRENVKILTIHEAQGVEFDTVFLVGINEQTVTPNTSESSLVITSERVKVNKDLVYVALTRAVNNLVVTGSCKLSATFLATKSL